MILAKVVYGKNKSGLSTNAVHLHVYAYNDNLLK